MPSVGLEPTIPVFESEKTVHALDRAATVSGIHLHGVMIHMAETMTLLCYQSSISSIRYTNEGNA
jgi:hypothetical protein